MAQFIIQFMSVYLILSLWTDFPYFRALGTHTHRRTTRPAAGRALLVGWGGGYGNRPKAGVNQIYRHTINDMLQ